VDIQRFDDKSLISFSKAIKIYEGENKTFRRALGALGDSGQIILDTYARNSFGMECRGEVICRFVGFFQDFCEHKSNDIGQLEDIEKRAVIGLISFIVRDGVALEDDLFFSKGVDVGGLHVRRVGIKNTIQTICILVKFYIRLLF